MTSPSHTLTAAALAMLLAGCGAPDGDTGAASLPPNGNDTTLARPEPTTSPAASTNAAMPETATADDSAPVLGIDGEGLRFIDPESGSTRPIPFGTPRDATLAALGSLGTPKLSAQDECGEGPIRTAAFPNGLQVHFQEDKFAGWFLDSSASKRLTTMTGLGIGSTRAALDEGYSGAKVERSTIGNEFFVGGMGGLVDGTGPAARVTDLWAGVTCIMR